MAHCESAVTIIAALAVARTTAIGKFFSTVDGVPTEWLATSEFGTAQHVRQKNASVKNVFLCQVSYATRAHALSFSTSRTRMCAVPSIKKFLRRNSKFHQIQGDGLLGHFGLIGLDLSTSTLTTVLAVRHNHTLYENHPGFHDTSDSLARWPVTNVIHCVVLQRTTPMIEQERTRWAEAACCNAWQVQGRSSGHLAIACAFKQASVMMSFQAKSTLLHKSALDANATLVFPQLSLQRIRSGLRVRLV